MDDTALLHWLQQPTVFGISPGNALFAVLVTLVAFVAVSTALRIAHGRLSALAARTSTHADDVLVEVLGGTSRLLIALMALLIGLGMVDLPERWAARVGQLWFLALALQMGLWLNRAVGIGLRKYAARHAGGQGSAQVSAATALMSWGLRIVLWSVVLLAILSNLGVNITAFVASLGVGGIAVALAAQNVLGDLFASIAIAMDKPFEVGDFIVVGGGVSGTVEFVGVKTTRLRSLGGEQVVLGNTELLKQTINNYKRLRERRIVFGFGVSYATTADQAAAIPGVLREIVQAGEKLRFDRAHFKALGESSLDYEVVYIVREPDYALYMDEQQRINLELMRRLAAMGVDFAFPTRTLHVASMPAAAQEPAPVRQASAAAISQAWPSVPRRIGAP